MVIPVDTSLDVKPFIRKSIGTTRIVIFEPREARPSGRRTSSKPKDTKPPETHTSSFGVVYVNELARHALLNEKRPRFPVGSVIVREKLLEPSSTTPEAVVLMVKRERGFNRKANDWEFLMLDGKLGNVMRREKTGSCSDCHTQQKERDFVFRIYLPESLRTGQK